jgi:serine/threonine protein kinase
MPLDPRRVKELFEAALELPDHQARQAFIDGECGADDELRQRLHMLFAAHEAPHAALNQPLVAEVPGATAAYESLTAPAKAVGSVIGGKYKLLQEIGEGGMGSVFMADQTHPVKRRVAVKVIKAGMDSARVLARFEAERQALALMDHANIAKVLDAATTETGQPFFVMELVKGIPLTQFCDEHKLPVLDRLKLFMQVCSAVQHAHQKGIIHRDLKPTNILVESHDGKPVPKVIDFGLAKATSGIQLTEHTLFTALGQVAGTPLYMAPEQAAFNAVDVDTRADVYALGVILYELLTGTTPIAREAFKKAAFDEMLRVIREQEPPTPSSRISSSESKGSVAALRQMEPIKLGRFVRGELDWIVMKSLSKERDRRYESATALARDVERFLNHEPVQAGPPSASYKLRKFVRRNRPLVIAVAVMLFALIAGMTGTTFGLVRAEQQRSLAEDAAKEERRAKKQAEHDRDAKEEARQKEEQERKYAQAIADFVRNDFLALTSVEGQYKFGRDIKAHLDKNSTLRQLLDRAAEKLNRRNDLDPRIEADLRLIIGLNYRALGEAQLAIPILQRCVTLRQQSFGLGDVSTLEAENELAVAFLRAEEYEKAIDLFEKAREAEQSTGDPMAFLTLNNLAMATRPSENTRRRLSYWKGFVTLNW